MRSRRKTFLGGLLAAAIALSLAGTSSAGYVTLVNNSAFGRSWDYGPDWSDGLPAGPGNDYHVGDSTGRNLRTPNNISNPTFPGDSLTIHSTGTLGTKHYGNAQIADLRLDGGALSAWVGNRTMGFTGTLTVLSPSRLSMSSTSDSRRIVIASQLTGSGGLTVVGADSNDYVRLTHNANTYTGNWAVTGGRLEAAGTGSLGTGSVTIGSARLYVTSTESIAGLTGTGGAEMRVGYNASGSLAVAPGTVLFGTSGSPGNLYIGNRGVGGAGNYAGVLDLSGSTFTAYLTNFDLGTTRSGGNLETAQGTVTLGTTNTIEANRILICDSTHSGQSGVGVASTLHLGGTNNLRVNTVTVGGRKGEGYLDIPGGGTLDLSSRSGGRADLFIGRNNYNTGTRAFGEMDLSAASRFDALLDEVIIGQKTGGGSGRGVGRLLLADTNDIDARSILIGYSDNGGQTGSGDQSRLILGRANTIRADSFTIGGRKSNALVEYAAPGGTLALTGSSGARTDLYVSYNNVNSGTVAQGRLDLSAGGAFDADLGTVYVGVKSGGGSGGANGTWLGGNGGTVSIGGGASDNFYIARITSGTNDRDINGTVDLSGQDAVNINVGNLLLGTTNARGKTRATLELGASNVVTANTIRISDVEAGSTPGQHLSTIVLGASNDFNVDTFKIGGRKGQGSVAFAAPGSMLDLAGNNNARADLQIGYNNIGTAANVVGTLDLSNGRFRASIDDLVVGHKSGGNTGSGTGLLSISDDAGNDVNVNNISLAQLSSSGSATGTITMRGGTFVVNGGIADGGGTSNLYVEGGTMTVGSGLSVDNLRVGVNGRDGVLNVNGGAVRVGSGTGNSMHVGFRNTNVGTSAASQFTGRMDMSAASAFTANVNVLGIGYVIPAGSGQTYPTGELVLAQSNDITANQIFLAYSTAVGLGGKTNRLTFGATNDVKADLVVIGGSKGVGVADIVPGGVLDLTSRAGGRADLFIGRQNVGTGGGANGTLDLGGGTFNALLDELVIGTKVSGARGTTQGTLVFGGGYIDANSVVLAHHEPASSGSNTTRGTLTMSGGVLEAGTIQLVQRTGAGGTASATVNLSGGAVKAGSLIVGDPNIIVNWTGGRVSIDSIGFPLPQFAGTLAPGYTAGSGVEIEHTPGTTAIAGDYDLLGGILEIDIAGYNQGSEYDFVDVNGDALLDSTLAVYLLEPFTPFQGDVFDVLTAADITLEDGFALDQYLGITGASHFIHHVIPGGNGEILRLEYVPEPATIALLGLGALGVLIRRRRGSNKA